MENNAAVHGAKASPVPHACDVSRVGMSSCSRASHSRIISTGSSLSATVSFVIKLDVGVAKCNKKKTKKKRCSSSSIKFREQIHSERYSRRDIRKKIQTAERDVSSMKKRVLINNESFIETDFAKLSAGTLKVKNYCKPQSIANFVTKYKILSRIHHEVYGSEDILR